MPAKLPLAWRNAPVPPRIFCVCRMRTSVAQVCGLTDTVKDLLLVTRCIPPPGKTRLSRLTVSGSPGRCATSTTPGARERAAGDDPGANDRAGARLARGDDHAPERLLAG